MKKLGVIDISGVLHDVRIGTSGDNKNLGSAFGCFEPSDLTIWLEAGMAKEKTGETLVHETLHAIWALSGANYATAAALGISADDPRLTAWEEMIVRVLTPHVKHVFGLPKVRK